MLEQAGADDAEMLIAVTNADEVNMVACQVAHSLFNVPTKIARIRQQSYLQSRWQDLFRREHLPIDVIISPELEVARAIARRLEVPGATEVTPFADDRVRLIAARCGPDCPILDTPLRQLTFLFPDLHLTCVGITRGDRFFIPDRRRPSDRRRRGLFVVETSHVGRAHARLRPRGADGRADRDRAAAAMSACSSAQRAGSAAGRRSTLTLIESDPERARLRRRQAGPQPWSCTATSRDREILEEADLARGRGDRHA